MNDARQGLMSALGKVTAYLGNGENWDACGVTLAAQMLIARLTEHEAAQAEEIASLKAELAKLQEAAAAVAVRGRRRRATETAGG